MHLSEDPLFKILFLAIIICDISMISHRNMWHSLPVGPLLLFFLLGALPFHLLGDAHKHHTSLIGLSDVEDFCWIKAFAALPQNDQVRQRSQIFFNI